MTVYLDNAATTAPHPQVVEAMLEMLRDDWGNPSSGHRIGQAARARAEMITRATIDSTAAARARRNWPMMKPRAAQRISKAQPFPRSTRNADSSSATGVMWPTCLSRRPSSSR